MNCEREVSQEGNFHIPTSEDCNGSDQLDALELVLYKHNPRLTEIGVSRSILKQGRDDTGATQRNYLNSGGTFVVFNGRRTSGSGSSGVVEVYGTEDAQNLAYEIDAALDLATQRDPDSIHINRDTNFYAKVQGAAEKLKTEYEANR
ncbi:hypothetical protein COV18_05485 [Candidatus Woesearchaeota archaeon CG10_big_fil_rev_8_21_14_0_10_37_12]|nr:MAG: hypothetical protein COV18_05485 [Candidatus Woesearchaeota archaeon CG10_big_fil_rev_8_21_14_0_10_37_12]